MSIHHSQKTEPWIARGYYSHEMSVIWSNLLKIYFKDLNFRPHNLSILCFFEKF